jgi:hypothetical protein
LSTCTTRDSRPCRSVWILSPSSVVVVSFLIVLALKPAGWQDIDSTLMLDARTDLRWLSADCEFLGRWRKGDTRQYCRALLARALVTIFIDQHRLHLTVAAIVWLSVLVGKGVVLPDLLYR